MSLSVAAVAAFLASFPAHAESPAAGALREWVAAIDASPKWAANFKSIDEGAGRVTLNGLSVRSEGNDEAAFDVETLQVAGYRALAKGGFSASRLRIGPATATFGAFAYEIAGLTLKGVAFPDLGVALDPDHAFTSLAKIYTAASAIRIGQRPSFRPSLPPHRKPAGRVHRRNRRDLRRHLAERAQ